MTQNESLNLLQIDTSILQDLRDILLNPQPGDGTLQQIDDMRWRVLPVVSRPHIKEQLRSCGLVSDVETVVREVEPFVAWNVGFHQVVWRSNDWRPRQPVYIVGL